jgi:hypothetical protein
MGSDEVREVMIFVKAGEWLIGGQKFIEKAREHCTPFLRARSLGRNLA